MNAMILAAGRGERMRPLTDTCPKPLLSVGGSPLIDYHLAALAAAGFARVVVNLAWQGQRLREHIGKGARQGVEVRFSDEGDHALETAGGIAHALPLLGPEPFVAINGDIYTDFPLQQLTLKAGDQAHLVLVDNPDHHRGGDFGLVGDRVCTGGGSRLTYAGVGVFHPALFADLAPGPARLAPLLQAAANAGALGGQHYRGRWYDVGTPERLRALDAALAP